MTLAVINQITQEKLRCLLHDRIGPLRKKLAVASKIIVFPQMQTQPRAAHGPDPGPDPVDWNGVAPDVGVVMNYKTTRAVKVPGHPPSIFARILNQIEQGLV